MLLKNLVLLVIIFITSACTSNPTAPEDNWFVFNEDSEWRATSIDRDYPVFDYKEADMSIAFVKFEAGTSLNPFPECRDPDSVCFDPPPLLLKTKVLQTVAGKQLPELINVATTHHHGLVFMASHAMYSEGMLVKIYNKDANFVMPRYNYAGATLDIHGQPVLKARDGKHVGSVGITHCLEKLKPRVIEHTKANRSNSVQLPKTDSVSIENYYYYDFLSSRNQYDEADICPSYREPNLRLTCLQNIVEAHPEFSKLDREEKIKNDLRRKRKEYEDALEYYAENDAYMYVDKGHAFHKYGYFVSDLKAHLGELSQKELKSCGK